MKTGKYTSKYDLLNNVKQLVFIIQDYSQDPLHSFTIDMNMVVCMCHKNNPE